MPKDMGNPVNAISHLVKEPDWLMLRCMPPRACAEAIQSILKALEGVDQFVYAVRGEALRLFDDRNLYLEYTDPATGQPCTCTYRFLEIFMPESARYSQEALVSRQRLQAIPLEVAAKLTRANLRLLEPVDEKVKADPKVWEAAETQTSEQFAATLNRTYGQHVDKQFRVTLKFESKDQWDAIQLACDDLAQEIVAHGGPELTTRENELFYWACDRLAEKASV